MNKNSLNRQIRSSEDGNINMVQETDGSLTIALQGDIDNLPVGTDLTPEEIESLDS